MNLYSKIQVGAQFKLIVHKGDVTKPTKEVPFFKNLVLDSGLNQLSIDNVLSRVCVGSGNTPPEYNQTSLENFIASTNTVQGGDTTGTNANDPMYYWAKRTFRFGEGVARGNLSEIGVGWSDSGLFNRALIKNSNGEPTTITVLSDEFLDVIVEVRVYPQKTFSGEFSLKNKLGEVVSTHSVTGTIFTKSNILAFTLGRISAEQRFIVYSGNMQESTSAEPINYIGDTTEVVISYPTQRSIEATSKFLLNSANGSHRSFVSHYSSFLGRQGFKWEINPPISKNNTFEITYKHTLSWDRYEPT